MGTTNAKALAKQGVDQSIHNTAMTLSPDVVANLVINGDLSRLTPAQKVNYYNSLCARVGLDPATQPFKLLKLKGKEVMYADKGATQQLSQIHKISHDVVSREKDEDTYTVTIRASLPDGRFTVEDGSVSLFDNDSGQPYKREGLANQKMKAMTKAKRRAVLALIGLGMIDESELDNIAGAEVITIAEAVDEAQTAIGQGVRETGGDKSRGAGSVSEVHAPVVSKEAAPAGKALTSPTQADPVMTNDRDWFKTSLDAIAACGKTGNKDQARAWGVEGKKRLQAGTLTQDEFNQIVTAMVNAFPNAVAPAPKQEALFDAKGEPTPEAKPEPSPEKKKAAKKKAVAGDPATDQVTGFYDSIALTDKYSALFTLMKKIEKAQIPDKDRKELGELLNKKLASLKGKK